MTKRFVYLAGPIAGTTYKEATNWRQFVTDRFSPGIVGVSPMRLKEWCKRIPVIQDIEQYKSMTTEEEFLVSGESHAIQTRDHFDVRTVDMIFINLPRELNERRPSWGTAIEIGWGSAYNKPAVLVTDDDNLANHPLVRESVGWIVPDLELGVQVVNSVLTTYT